ncbi:MAG: hypothetical protein ACI909_002509 [Planctomycetota bacterium]|jgi:hypothetical protein
MSEFSLTSSHAPRGNADLCHVREGFLHRGCESHSMSIGKGININLQCRSVDEFKLGMDSHAERGNQNAVHKKAHIKLVLKFLLPFGVGAVM